MSTVIDAIAYALPEQTLTNQQLHEQHPDWDMKSVEEKAGVLSRPVALSGETAFSLAVQACERLFGETSVPVDDVDAIIFCTQTPDYPMPGNAHLLHAQLGLSDRVLAFDYNLACSGFIYGLAIAHSLLQAKLASHLLLVNADTYSKLINPNDRSARVLFGDGAAATLLHTVDGPGMLRDFLLCSHGKEFQKFYVPAGGCRRPRSAETCLEASDRNGNVRSAEQIHMDGFGVWSFINSVVPAHIRHVVERNGLTLDGIDHFVFHQASRMTLESLIRVLGIPPEKAYVGLAHTGNLVSASIPVALRDLFDKGRIRAGEKVLLCGFGVGLSYGSVLMEMESPGR